MDDTVEGCNSKQPIVNNFDTLNKLYRLLFAYLPITVTMAIYVTENFSLLKQTCLIIKFLPFSDQI